MKIGVDYYPEHWDRTLWRQDADLMKKSGVELVRMAEFAWSKMEPEEGIFDFAWLDGGIICREGDRSDPVYAYELSAIVAV